MTSKEAWHRGYVEGKKKHHSYTWSFSRWQSVTVLYTHYYLKLGDHSDHFVVSSGGRPLSISVCKHSVHQRVLRFLQELDQLRGDWVLQEVPKTHHLHTVFRERHYYKLVWTCTTEVDILLCELQTSSPIYIIN